MGRQYPEWSLKKEWKSQAPARFKTSGKSRNERGVGSTRSGHRKARVEKKKCQLAVWVNESTFTVGMHKRLWRNKLSIFSPQNRENFVAVKFNTIMCLHVNSTAFLPHHTSQAPLETTQCRHRLHAVTNGLIITGHAANSGSAVNVKRVLLCYAPIPCR